MRKNLIARMAWSTIFVIALTTIANAQEGTSRLQRYGVKAGAQLSTIPKGESEYFDTKIKPVLGYQLGGFVTIGLSGDLSLQTELFLSGQGFKEWQRFNVIGGESMEETFKYAMRYVKLPMLLRYGIARKVFVEAGPQFGIFVSSNIEKDEWSHFKKFDFAGAIGAEYLLSDQISVQFRYAHSFAKIEDPESYVWIPERPRVFSIGLAYTL